MKARKKEFKELDRMVEQLNKLKKPEITVACGNTYEKMFRASKILQDCAPEATVDVEITPDFFLRRLLSSRISKKSSLR